MRKGYAFVVSVCLSVFAFFFCCGFRKDGGIKDIVKPYIGVYTCQSARLDDDDFLCYFKKVTVELKEDGSFVLTASPKIGRRISFGGEYAYDKDADGFFLRANVKKELPEGRMEIKKGKLYIRVRYGEKFFFACFTR